MAPSVDFHVRPTFTSSFWIMRDVTISIASCPLQTPSPLHFSSVQLWLQNFTTPPCKSAPLPSTHQSSFPCQRAASLPWDAMPKLSSLYGAESQSEKTLIEKSREEKNQSSSSTYRKEVLERNGMRYVKSGPVPSEVSAKISSIVNAPRQSPPMTDEEAQRLATAAENSVEDAENELISHVIRYHAPNASLYSQAKKSENMPFYNHTIPNDPAVKNSPSIPKPDMTYGYRDDGYESFQKFANEQAYNGQNLYRHTQILKDNSLPFFLWEVKSQCTGGNIYHAVNQTITGGSTLVKAARALAVLTDKYSKTPHIPADTIAFSVAVDNATLQLQVHWYSANQVQYLTQRYQTFSLVDPKTIQELHRVVKNVLDWGYKDRYSLIRNQLSILFEATQTKMPAYPESASIDHHDFIARHQVRMKDHDAWCQSNNGFTSSLSSDPKMRPPQKNSHSVKDQAVVGKRKFQRKDYMLIMIAVLKSNFRKPNRID